MPSQIQSLHPMALLEQSEDTQITTAYGVIIIVCFLALLEQSKDTQITTAYGVIIIVYFLSISL